MATPKLPRRTKFTILAVFIAIGLVGLFLGDPLGRFRANEDQACYEKCKALNKFSRLIPALPAGSVTPGKYDGPWACECY
jgi:hypothetical protein